MGTTAEKLTYLNTTKGKIKDSINLTGAGITNNDTFRSYATKLRDGLVNVLNNGTATLYNNFPKVNGTGSSITLNDTLEAPMRNKMFKGNTLQNGTPTPDTPVEIQSVKGIQNVNICGKNLFNKNTITSGKLVSRDNGNLENSSNYGASDYIPMEENTTYTLDNNTFNRWYSACYDKNKNYIGYVSNSNTFTTIANTKYMRFTVYLNKVDEAMIVKGNTLPTTYEAYTGNTYEVNLEGVQLFNFNSANYVGNDTTTITGTADDFTISGNGNALRAYCIGLINFNTLYKYMSNSYTILSMSLYITEQSSYNNWTSYSSNRQQISTDGNWNTNTMDLSNYQGKYLWIQLRGGSAGQGYTSVNYKNFILSKKEINSYVPYRSPIKLYNGDYITGTLDNWSIVRNNKEKIFNGSEEGWTLLTTSNLNNYLIDGQINDINYVSNVINYKSNYYNGILNANRYQDNTFFVNNNKRIVFTNNSITSVNNWKTNLATNNISVVYPLATPTTEAITDTYLISQLNALYNAKSYNGQTNITVSGNLPMILEVSALKDEI